MEHMDNTLDAASQAGKMPRRGQPLWRQVLRPLASLRLTVVLFVLSLLLVFYGTLAQKDQDVWDVVHEYFWSWGVRVPNQLHLLFAQVFFGAPTEARWTEAYLPLPGGKLLFWALLVNLLSAHLVRFRLSWQRSGIFMIHGGLLMMMAGEFVTREFAEENNMTIMEGGKADFVESLRFFELAFTRARPDGQIDTVVVPQELLRQAIKSGAPIQDEALPFQVKVLSYAGNCDLLEKPFPADFQNPATQGEGLTLRVSERPPVSGVDPEQRINMPGAEVELLEKGSGKSLGVWVVSAWFQLTRPIRTQKVTPDAPADESWKVALRNKRGYRPYTITLNKFTHDVYPGTDKPLNFQSDVLLQDPDMGVERTTVIRMNEPMRHAGETFYQHQALAGDSGSVLQVVRNPGWTLPYLSCAVVSLGMLTHFGAILLRHLRKQA